MGGETLPTFTLAKLLKMIKAMIKFFKNLYDREIDYEFEFEFSIYDVLAAAGLLIFALWLILR